MVSYEESVRNYKAVCNINVTEPRLYKFLIYKDNSVWHEEDGFFEYKEPSVMGDFMLKPVYNEGGFKCFKAFKDSGEVFKISHEECVGLIRFARDLPYNKYRSNQYSGEMELYETHVPYEYRNTIINGQLMLVGRGD